MSDLRTAEAALEILARELFVEDHSLHGGNTDRTTRGLWYREVGEALARAQGERWGYAQSLGADGFARYVRVQAEDANVRADAHVLWRLAAEHFGGAR